MDCPAAPLMAISELNEKKLILPSGYRFSPLDAELVVHYLKKKIVNQPLPVDIIPTIDVCFYGPPNQLPLSEFKYRMENEWYFFATRPKHNLLITSSGHWEEITSEEIFDGDEIVGFMQTLAFYFADPMQGMKIDWYIHEYSVNSGIFAAAELDNTTKEKMSNFVVCKVCCKEKDPNKLQEASSYRLHRISSDSITDSDEEEDIYIHTLMKNEMKMQ